MLRGKKTLLVVDDDRIFCETLRDAFENEELTVSFAQTAKECLAACSNQKTDVVLLDQKLPDREGHTLCTEILSYNDQTKIIFCTAFPNFDNAVTAIRAGAYDYLSKPFELDELRLTLDHALRTLDLEQVEEVQNYKNNREIRENVLIGNSEGMEAVRRLVDVAAGVDAAVFITGETGVGKNLVAQAIHNHGLDAKAPFISINCAALPENLIEAELFGYERGAFTGAASARKGIFEMSEGGTIFLDEIGEMPLHLQSKLLGVLDDKKIKRLGGETFRYVDVRIIAATSIDLEKAVREKTFREDLFYRLSVVKIHVPPLRERRMDIQDLCRHLLSKIAWGRDIRLQDKEISYMTAYEWPGNIRELRNILERAVIIQKGPEIRPSEMISRTISPKETSYTLPNSAEVANPCATLDEVEKKHIRQMLARFSGNLTHTAKGMGISLSTLKRKIKRYGIS